MPDGLWIVSRLCGLDYGMSLSVEVKTFLLFIFVHR